ncbi:MAG TPA: hypothetical protein VFV85_04210, partial [Conexibacter sp.]|nr:hypothetical protein [Conexibacter sp.]
MRDELRVHVAPFDEPQPGYELRAAGVDALTMGQFRTGTRCPRAALGGLRGGAARRRMPLPHKVAKELPQRDEREEVALRVTNAQVSLVRRGAAIVRPLERVGHRERAR